MTWIPVTERLPEPNVFVLVAVEARRPRRQVYEGYFTGIFWATPANRMLEPVTHWQPLPAPPEGA
jgi:hypothetical protein